MAEGNTPELRIRAVLEADGARATLADLQAQAARGINIGGSFAAESTRGTAGLISSPPIPTSSVATGIYQSPAPPAFGYVASPMQNLTGMVGFRPGVNAPSPVAFGPPPAPAPTAAPLTSGSPAESVGATMLDASDLVGGRGGGSLLPVGRGLTAMAFVHAGSQIIQHEGAYRQRLAAAGGDPGSIASAELRHRTDYDSMFFGIGRLGRFVRDLDPSGVSSGQVEGILNDTERQSRQIREQEQSLSYFHGLSQEVAVSTSQPGLARQLARIDEQSAGRHDRLRSEISGERERQDERNRAAVAGVENRLADEQRFHAFRLGPSRLRPFQEQLAAIETDRQRMSGIVGEREAAGLKQINSIDAAERQEARNESASRRAEIDVQTERYRAIAGGLRGRAADLAGTRAGVAARNRKAFIMGDENIEGIVEEGRQQVSAANVEIGRAAQLEQFRLRSDALVSKLGIGGGTAGAHLAAAAAAGQAGVLAADPQDVGLAEDAATQRYQGAVGAVVRQGAAGIAQWVRRRTAEGNAARRDVMHTAELQAQQGVAELQAAGKPVAATVLGILSETKLAVGALKTDDPEYTKQRDALRGLGVARLRAFQNSLADASQAVEVAPGTIAPGAGQGRVGAGGERDTGKQIADAVKEALGMGGNATGAASGNFIQKLERVADGLERFLGVVTGG